MTVAETHDASTQGEAPTWAWPVYAFVAWLVAVLNFIARFRRIRHGHRFRQDWRDSWEGLRQSEWLRDQLIAQGVKQLLSGNPLQLDDTKSQLTPPADYGGPCPRSPFDMNRRFLALARWAADPEAIIRERFRRLMAGSCPLRRAARATSPTLRVEEENRQRLSSSSRRLGEVACARFAHDGGGSRQLALNAQPRAPPAIPLRISSRFYPSALPRG